MAEVRSSGVGKPYYITPEGMFVVGYQQQHQQPQKKKKKKPAAFVSSDGTVVRKKQTKSRPSGHARVPVPSLVRVPRKRTEKELAAVKNARSLETYYTSDAQCQQRVKRPMKMLCTAFISHGPQMGERCGFCTNDTVTRMCKRHAKEYGLIAK